MRKKSKSAFFFSLAVLGGLAFGPRPAHSLELTGDSGRRVTRTSLNAGGTGAGRLSSSSYRLRGTLAETSSGLLVSASSKVADGLLNILYYPTAVTNLTPVTGFSAGEIDLQWTAPFSGEDNPALAAQRYVLKYSTFPAAISNQLEFYNAATYTQSIAPAAPGAQETFTLTGLTQDTTYYVAIEAQHGGTTKNQAYLSNSTSAVAMIYDLGVDIANTTGDPASYGFGALALSSAVVSTATIRVTNTGTAPATWSLRAATTTPGSPWVLNTDPPAMNKVKFSAAFDEVKPSTTVFSAFSNAVSTANVLASGTQFTIDQSSTGVNVGRNQLRNIWFLVETPTGTTTAQDQQIQVTVTANAP